MNLIVFFDGHCNLCNGAVKFLIKADKAAKLKFAPLQSEIASKHLAPFNYKPTGNGSILFIKDGKLYERSEAFLKIMNELPWYWKWLQVGGLLPNSFRDRLYNFVAANRYRWFGKKEECMVPTNDIRKRFLK